MFRPIALVGALLLSACTVNGNQDRFLAKYADPKPTLDRVTVCHGYGCSRQETVNLRRVWPQLVTVMAEPAPDAATERANIALAIAAIELEVGARTGTSQDIGGTFTGFAQDGQLDCVDEAANTTTYLTLMDDAGLLRWHEIRAPMSRGFFINGWPHTSAVIAEIASGETFVVDSWFHANGVPAEVVTLDQWVGGWSPENVESEQIVVTHVTPAAELESPPRTP